jgi:hypothetical protein
MMEEFLKTLYKVCSSQKDSGVDLLFDIVPGLLGQRKFDEVNLLLTKIDLSRLNTSVMYAVINATSDYRFQLPYWNNLYQSIREEFARRGETKKRIESLFDRYKEPDLKRLFNPNTPSHKSPEETMDDKIKTKLELARQLNDQDLEDMLNYYQAERLRYKERDDKFRKLRLLLGDEEIRKRCIKALREMADTLDETTAGWPGIYYCDLPEDPLFKKSFIASIEVCISYPWPG